MRIYKLFVPMVSWCCIDSACRKCHIIEMGWSYAVLFFSSFFAAVGGTKGSGSSFFSDSVSSNTFPSTSVTSRHLTIYSYLVKFCEDSWWMIKATIFWDMFTILFLLTKLAERFVIVNLAMHAWFSSKKSTFTVKKNDHSLKHVKTNLRFFGLR